MSRVFLCLSLIAVSVAGPLHAQLPPEISPTVQLIAPEVGELGNFGTVAIDGDTAVAGSSGLFDTAHIFLRNQGGPGQWGRVI